MTTSPLNSPLPALPATCVNSENTLSPALKSGSPNPLAALTTPTSVTPGASKPLAIIWVPVKISNSLFINFEIVWEITSLFLVES